MEHDPASRCATKTILCLLAWATAFSSARCAEAPIPKKFERGNLVAWCIVPFDAKKRSPEERAAMLKRLGFKRYAYDWRAEHLPTFEREVAALKVNGIELTALWFPARLDADARRLFDVLKRHQLHPQLWVTMGEPIGKDQREKIASAADTLLPLVVEADKLGCKVALYNHGGWFGEPENQLAILERLQRKNVGIVYNLHHGHEHLQRFADLLTKMQPHLFALNLNGMTVNGDKQGRKILPLGQGELDRQLLKIIADSDYNGPIGILGHTSDDAEERLKDNLDGLDWLLSQLVGKPPGPKPKPRTMRAESSSAPSSGGWLAEGKPAYRTPPLTVECRARINRKDTFNILVASDTKASSEHWEMFTWPNTGHLTVYLPGHTPDHVRSETDICDKQWHNIAMQYEANRVRLFVDGKAVAERALTRAKTNAVPGAIGFARLVEGGLGCDGDLERVRISKGIVAPSEMERTANENTLGLWTFTARDKPAVDASKYKNAAKPVAVTSVPVVEPPSGPNLTPTDPKWRIALLDRSMNDAYLAVKVDGAGRVFVGGREKVFVFEPDGKGGFGPRVELLRLPPDSIVIGLEYRGDDLFVLASHGLYLVAGGRVKREGLKPKRILWGVPLNFHNSFHCLAWGPDGLLYLDHGDPLLDYGDWTRPDHWGCWTLFAGPDGKKTPYTGAGAVLKVLPDGSSPQVLARGLRGPVGLAFDKHWNLFTNDNDHESRAELYAPMRLLHVTPHADFAWPRGWMASKSTDRFDLLDSLHPALGRGVPCDMAFLDDTDRPGERGSLLMCRWGRFAVTKYPLQPQGASFTAEERVFAQGTNQCRPTGVTVDAAGRVFITSLYLAGNVVSPYCPSDLVVMTPPGSNSPKSFDETTASLAELWTALDGKSWEVRRRVHVELLRRGEGLETALERLQTIRDDAPSAAHLPWLAAASGAKATATLTALALDRTKPVLRLQSLRALAAFPKLKPEAKAFVAALVDPNPVVQLAGVEGLFVIETPLPLEQVAKLAGGEDSALRQSAATLLARRAAIRDLEALAKANDAPARLAAVLAGGIRLTVPPPDAPPPAGVKLFFPQRSAFFSPTLRFADADAPVELTALGPIGSYTSAERWAVGRHTPAEERLFQLLQTALTDRDDRIRSQSAYYLSWLRDPRTEPQLQRTRWELRTHGLTDRPAIPVKAIWRIGRFDPKAAATIERGPIDLTAGFTIGTRKFVWEKVAADDGSLPLPQGKGAVYAYFRIHSRDRQPALLTVAPSEVRVWHNGRAAASEVSGSFLLELQPGSNDVLIRTDHIGSLAMNVRARGNVSTMLPEKIDGPTLADRLKSAKGATTIAPEFQKFDWTTEGKRGDASRGRKLFGSLGCVKCHAIAPDQTSNGAPSLVDAGKRFTPAHLAESILLPDRLVADEFRSSSVVTKGGRSLVGLVIRESATEIELLMSDTTRQVVRVATVEERKRLTTSPMPSGLVKTADELRDLLGYLLSERPQPP